MLLSTNRNRIRISSPVSVLRERKATVMGCREPGVAGFQSNPLPPQTMCRRSSTSVD